MSHESFFSRLPQNVTGKYYVTAQCLDCDLCRETAPMLLRRADEYGVAYFYKQPSTESEIKQAIECIEGCPCEAIFDDGDQHDWNGPIEDSVSRLDDPKYQKPTCAHCQPKKKWWQIWK